MAKLTKLPPVVSPSRKIILKTVLSEHGAELLKHFQSLRNEMSVFRPGIGKRLKEVLHGHDKRELSVILGISRATIYGWTSGRFLPDLERLWLLSVMLDFSIPWLLTGKGKRRGSAEGYIPLKSPFWIGQERGYADSDFAVKPEWIEKLPGSRKPGALILFRASGDAMRPIIEHGDQLLIDTADREKRDGVIYAVEALSLSERSGSETTERQQAGPLPLLIRRLVRQLDIEDGYQLICDNPNFPPSAAKFQVFGRVVWYGREL